MLWETEGVESSWDLGFTKVEENAQNVGYRLQPVLFLVGNTIFGIVFFF